MAKPSPLQQNDNKLISSTRHGKKEGKIYSYFFIQRTSVIQDIMQHTPKIKISWFLKYFLSIEICIYNLNFKVRQAKNLEFMEDFETKDHLKLV